MTTQHRIGSAAVRVHLLAMAALVLLTACSGANVDSTRPTPVPTLTSTRVSPTPTTTGSAPRPHLATPVFQEPAAGICAGVSGDLVMVTVHPDVPDPRCARVTPNQRLKLVNRTQRPVQVAVGHLETTIEPEGAYTFDVPFGEYLAPGVHPVRVLPCCGPGLWLVGQDTGGH